jgi:hypothetical protein
VKTRRRNDNTPPPPPPPPPPKQAKPQQEQPKPRTEQTKSRTNAEDGQAKGRIWKNRKKKTSGYGNAPEKRNPRTPRKRARALRDRMAHTHQPHTASRREQAAGAQKAPAAKSGESG